MTTSSLIAQYQKAGCPLPNLTPRTPEYTARQLAKVAEFFGSRDPATIKVPDCVKYHAWRKRDRACELELAALSACFNWAVSAGLIEANYIRSGRPRFVREVVHCREKAFTTPEELHDAAAMFLASRKSPVLGFQLLVEAFTGLRTNEVLSLQMDAKRGEPGHVDGNCLWVRRSKRGVNPFVQIHDALKSVMDRHRSWHAGRSPWWFPGSDLVRPVARQSLTNALRRVFGDKTSHGLRSFYVTARRSQGVTDERIAAEIGDSTVSLISRTYGDVPPSWATGAKPTQWVPEGLKPAWERVSISI